MRILDLYDSVHKYRQVTDEFERGTADEVWISGIAERYPESVILSGDQRILKDKTQRMILHESGLSFIYPSKPLANAVFEVQIWQILKVWPEVLEEVVPAQELRKPGVWEIPVGGNKLIKRGKM